LKIDNKKIIKVDELAEIIPFKSGATWSALWQIFYYTRLFKYIHKQHYPRIKTAYNKICTDKNLQKLCSLGYFKSPQKNVYCATNKVLPILNEVGVYPVNVLPNEPTGSGSINELNNTEVFIQASKQANFCTLLYCNFGYLIPDALMLQLDREAKKYKLTFLEIEAEKPGWSNYIDIKRYNYLKLATDIQFYNYWNKIAKLIDLPIPNVNTLTFSVCFIGKIKKDFGKGFYFIEHF